MKIKLPQLIIEENEPFKNDALNRKESAETLCQFVKSLDEPYVIALDSPWGTGKTTFLQMWRAFLKSQDIHSLYFNAWENDFSSDPLVSFINEIETHFDTLSLETRNKGKAKKYLKAAEKVGYGLLKRGAPVALRLATYGILDADKITEDILSKASEEFAKEQFVEYEAAKKSISKFKENLEKYCQEITDKTPLVFIVDEMDRCRPDYAVQILEKIKHFFSIPNIVFVLGMDRQQIGYSIETLYGKGMDVSGYLSRFIDYDYHLPVPKTESFINFLVERHGIQDFLDSRNNYPSLRSDKESLVNSLKALLVPLQISLRDIEHILSQMAIVIRLTKENEFLHPPLLTLLIILRVKFKDTYNRVRQHSITAPEVFTAMNISIRDYYRFLFMAYFEISAYNANRTTEDPQDKYQRVINNSSSNQEKSAEAQQVRGLIIKLTNEHDEDIVNFLSNKIELSYQFS